MPRKPKFETWQAKFHALLQSRTKNLWDIADSYNEGERWFGEEVAQAVEPRLMSESRLQTVAGVGRKFSGENEAYRYLPDRLSFSHHEAVRSLIGNDDHPEWEEDAWSILADADAKGLSVSDVEELVREAKGETLKDDFLKSPVELLADLYNELTTCANGLPPDWDEERALLDKAEGHVVTALNSARNRSVGDPAQMELAA